jgi:hypothetical protein
VLQQRNKYSDDLLKLGDVIATPLRTGYRSFEPRLLQHIKNPEAESGLCRRRKALKEYEPLSVVALDDQHIDMQLPSTYRADSHLHFHPYKLHIMQELSDRDFASRSALCKQFFTLVKEHSEEDGTDTLSRNVGKQLPHDDA